MQYGFEFLKARVVFRLPRHQISLAMPLYNRLNWLINRFGTGYHKVLIKQRNLSVNRQGVISKHC